METVFCEVIFRGDHDLDGLYEFQIVPKIGEDIAFQTDSKRWKVWKVLHTIVPVAETTIYVDRIFE